MDDCIHDELFKIERDTSMNLKLWNFCSWTKTTHI